MSPGDSQAFWLAVPVEVPFLVTSRFNSPRNYANNPDKKQQHEGIDLNAVDAAGRPVGVLAAQRGLVDKVANFPPGYGLYVRIRHDWPDGNRYVTWYGHLSKIEVKEGDFVQAGQRIGISGDTGNSFGIHLHLTLQRIGSGLPDYVVDDVVDPEPFFTFGAPPQADECMFLSDETVPDGTVLLPGQAFPKTWRVRNTGTARWGPGYVLSFFDGDRLGGPDSVPLPALSPGEEGSVTVNLVAPGSSGRHRSTWKGRNPQGQFFAFELFTEIVVGAPQQDGATFLADVTIPDGTEVPPGETFLKTWRVRNSGSTTWTTGYQLSFFGDDRLGAPESLPAPFTRAGQEQEVSITLRAPEIPGAYQSTWRLRNRQGQFFGDVFFAMIQVPRPEDPEVEVDEMSYVDDVTIEDGTRLQPGQTFEKIWRVRNTGTSSWGLGYDLVFFGDDRMGGPDKIPLPAAAPGQTVDLALRLTAPTQPGTHRSTWKGRNPAGQLFEFDMFAEIEVVQRAGAPGGVDDAKFVDDVTVPDGAVKQAGEVFLKTWRIRNTGTTTWGPSYELAFLKDDRMAAQASTALSPVAPGQEINVSVRLTAPLNPGEHRSTWRLRNPQQAFFGHEYYALINVPAPETPRDVQDAAALMGHETLQPGSRVAAGQLLKKIWGVRNTGTTTWGLGYTLAYLEGEQLVDRDSFPVPAAESLKTARISLEFQVPETPGRYRSVWRLRGPQGDLFGPRLVISFQVG